MDVCFGDLFCVHMEQNNFFSVGKNLKGYINFVFLQ